jgi:hypothetical protein
VLPGEVDQVGRGGPGERVDRLAGVTDHGEVVTPAQPRVEQPLLQRVDVLVFVDHEVAVLRTHLLGHVGVLLEPPDRGPQHVFEVDHAVGPLQRLVGGEHLRHPRRLERRLPGRLRRRDRVFGRLDQRRLRPFDLAGEVARGRPIGADAGPRGGQRDQPRLALEQLRHLPPGEQPGREVAHLPQRRRVERARLHPADPERGQPGAHLRRRPGGERDRQHVLGRDRPAQRPVGDPVGDRPGLAGARTGEDADRAGGRGHGGALLRIEPRQDLLRR